ncbi:hypothetical protein [Saccharicrinis fermentans]|uniref:Uncharacterized protein n=1 Tax=Saccharicrinis fermentans DSM 9555 = JCM 21142 TaxID=869213 RepID=W7Y9W6_9BACT|nr:hypothetical protein [Saccharicrinis fermentans]GAF05107.1 hypothetical protein JCM21142_93831 [Saccharicrinis fermentans DSM 9555 = JCM 21142]
MYPEVSFFKRNNVSIRIVVTLFLLELLYLLNRDVLRPSFRSNEAVVVLLGSLPNFLAAFGVCLALIPLCLRWGDKKVGRSFVYLVSIICWGLLMQEEITPFAFGSCVNDVNDMIASTIGTAVGIGFYEMLVPDQV